MIARRQVVRLIDRLLTKVAPDLILNRQIENKENQVDAQNSAAHGTPARPVPRQNADRDRQDRKNLALQFNKDNTSSTAAPQPLLEQAPESERSEAFSIPVSDGDNSARQGFNQV